MRSRLNASYTVVFTKCSRHPRYKGKSKPRGACALCWHVWHHAETTRWLDGIRALALRRK